MSKVSWTPSFSRSMPMALREKGMVTLGWFQPGTHVQSKWSSMGICSSCSDARRQYEYILSISSPSTFLTVFVPLISLNILVMMSLSASVRSGGSILLKEKALSVVQDTFAELTSSQLQKLPFSTTARLANVIISLMPSAVPEPLIADPPLLDHWKAMVTYNLPPKITMMSSPRMSACCWESRQQKTGFALQTMQVALSGLVQKTSGNNAIFYWIFWNARVSSSCFPSEQRPKKSK